MKYAWTEFHTLYCPNKEVNLDTTLKIWESFTDEDFPFCRVSWQVQYTKLILEKETIGQPPTEAKRCEMLRRNVKNPYLPTFESSLAHFLKVAFIIVPISIRTYSR